MTEFATDVLTLPAQSDPAAVAANGKVYSKMVSGVTQLFYIDSAGNVRQMTPVSFAPGAVSYASSERMITYASSGGMALTNSTDPQNLFPAGRSTATLSANYSYRIRARYRLLYSGTPNTHASQVLFALSTTTFSKFEYVARAYYGVSGGTTTAQNAQATIPGLTNVTTSITNINRVIWIDGRFTTIAGGTFTPQYAMSALPGVNAPIVYGVSYFELIPLGASGYTGQGSWSA